MSDGMAFLTGAAFAGVAVLFMLKGGTNIGATNVPSSQTLPFSQTNPYGMNPTPNPTATLASPGLPGYNTDQQKLEADRLKVMLEQQRTETEQLKAQLQNQQMLIEKLSVQNDPTNPNNPNNSLFTRNKPPQAVAPVQQDNPMLSGLVWALGGMAITISGGVVVVGALSVLSRQQRSGRTTYVVQQPSSYAALPPTLHPRRRTEVMPPQLDERRIDYVEYDR